MYLICHKLSVILTKITQIKMGVFIVLIKWRNSTFAPMALQKNVKIKNRKARFEYEVLDTYSAGIVLAGTEIKAIREGKASIAESFCEFHNGELFVINMTVQEYSHATHFNHNPKNERKLLLNRSELKKLEKEVKNSGLTIIPLVLYTNDNGVAKMQIALCKGKKEHDKRDSIRDRDNKRDLSRVKKAFNN
jgi:SsrA-binding protein